MGKGLLLQPAQQACYRSKNGFPIIFSNSDLRGRGDSFSPKFWSEKAPEYAQVLVVTWAKLISVTALLCPALPECRGACWSRVALFTFLTNTVISCHQLSPLRGLKLAQILWLPWENVEQQTQPFCPLLRNVPGARAKVRANTCFLGKALSCNPTKDSFRKVPGK